MFVSKTWGGATFLSSWNPWGSKAPSYEIDSIISFTYFNIVIGKKCLYDIIFGKGLKKGESFNQNVIDIIFSIPSKGGFEYI